MDNYKDYCCIDCAHIGFDPGTGDPYCCCEDGRGCLDDYQEACKAFVLYRDCENCKHFKHIGTNERSGREIYSCEAWDCNFIAKEQNNEP